MFHFEISEKNILIRNLKVCELSKIHEWYNITNEYKYATGIDKAVSIDFIKEKYLEAAICKNEFFAGIFLDNINLIGVIKGNIRHGQNGILWINSFIIESSFRKKRIGTCALELLLQYFKYNKNINTVFISVLKENDVGVLFWKKQMFMTITNIPVNMIENNFLGNTMIMSKKL